MTRWGGVEQLLVDLLQHVNQQSVQHFLLSTSSIPEVIEPVRAAGIPHFEPSRRHRFDPSSVAKAVQWLRANSIQIVHSYNAYANTWGRIVTSLAGIPVFICGEHGLVWNTTPPLYLFDRYSQRTADLIVANSCASATMLQNRYGVHPDKVRIVYNAIPPLPLQGEKNLRQELCISDKHSIVGSVGRLDTPKHYITLVEAARIVISARDDVQFVLVGGGPHEKYLREEVERYNLSERFHILGWRNDARNLIQDFDIFASTSIHESFGNALVEAALAGKPCIAPNVDGIPEVVVDGQTGILITPTEPIVDLGSGQAMSSRVLINSSISSPRALNPVKLAENIEYLLDNQSLIEQYGETARRRAEDRFSIERYTSQLEQIYLGQDR